MMMTTDETVNAMFTKGVNGVAKVISDQPTDAMAAVDTHDDRKNTSSALATMLPTLRNGPLVWPPASTPRKRCWMKTEQTKCAATLAAHFVKLYSIERERGGWNSANMPGRQRQRG